jgi:hypothetical protein
MSRGRFSLRNLLIGFAPICFALTAALAQTPAQPSPRSSARGGTKPAASPYADLDPGTITNGVYRNKTLAFTCRIPEGWVLRTDELNAHDESSNTATPAPDAAQPASSAGAKVLLAAFARPPQAKGEDINASILIAAENASAYPGLKDAVQYLAPIAEVAKAQGFAADEDAYEFAIGTKTLAREDFHKDVGKRVMRQSTLAMLAHGYAVSITVIGGTEDEVEELIDGLTFTTSTR